MFNVLNYTAVNDMQITYYREQIYNLISIGIKYGMIGFQLLTINRSINLI